MAEPKEKPKDFQRLGKTRLFGMSRLAGNQDLDATCKWLFKHGFRTIISIEADGAEKTKAAWSKFKGSKWYGTFLYDFNAPSATHLNAYVQLVQRRLKDAKRLDGEPAFIATHCWGGTGRTGCFLAAYLMATRSGTTAHEAVREVRAEYNIHAVEMPAQYNALARYGDIYCNVKSRRWDQSGRWKPDYKTGINYDPGHRGDLLVRDALGKPVRGEGKLKEHPINPLAKMYAGGRNGKRLSMPPFTYRSAKFKPKGIRD